MFLTFKIIMNLLFKFLTYSLEKACFNVCDLWSRRNTSLHLLTAQRLWHGRLRTHVGLSGSVGAYDSILTSQNTLHNPYGQSQRHYITFLHKNTPLHLKWFKAFSSVFPHTSCPSSLTCFAYLTLWREHMLRFS